MSAVMEVDEARSAYAEWFVKRHYLQQKRPFTGLHGEYVNRWHTAKNAGYIRYYVSDSGSERDEYDDLNTWSPLLSSRDKDKDKQWFRISLDDLDDPINDHHEIVKSYRWYRELAERERLWNWLIAEAQFHVISSEAWLRAYSIDPSEFPSGEPWSA